MIKSNLNKPIGILLFLSLISIYFFLWSNLNINSAELNIETPISEVENCKYKIANFEDYLIANKFDYVIETKFVSYIPELKNLSCYGLISDLQISNTDVIHIYINQSLVLKNILFIAFINSFSSITPPLDALHISTPFFIFENSLLEIIHSSPLT